VPTRAASLHVNEPAPSPLKRSIIADLNDGPTEYAQKQKLRVAQEFPPYPFDDDLHADSSAFLEHYSSFIQSPIYSEEERLQHQEAAKVAADYAQQYVRQTHGSGSRTRRKAPADVTSSLYEMMARTTEHGKAEQHQPYATEADDPALFEFADAGVFMEEGVKMKDPYDKQDWTYSDTDSPPEWLVPTGSEKQGCPTTKPPPVPRMPPPPPATPTPTWMSPFDEHNTPVFPHSATPAPFFGMGPVPPGPPSNYLPLDTFMSPAPEEE